MCVGSYVADAWVAEADELAETASTSHFFDDSVAGRHNVRSPWHQDIHSAMGPYDLQDRVSAHSVTRDDRPVRR